MPHAARARRLKVCHFSFHPMVLREVERVLEPGSFQLQTRSQQPDRFPDPAAIEIPRASLYLIDSHSRRATTEGLVDRILGRNPSSRVIVIAEEFKEANAFPLLRLGAKGLLTYRESALLPRAIKEVAAGGYWVPRSLLSRFVEVALNSGPPGRLLASANELTPRERQVLDFLLKSLSNKEIANALNISERTAKFHVSNLLAKYGVRRRADLILLNFTQSSER